MAGDERYRCDAHSAALLDAQRALRQQRLLCDVTLFTSDEKELPAHRAVLAAASNVFRAMFTTGFKESSTASPGEPVLVPLPTVSSTGLEPVTDFIYTGEITLNEDVVQAVLHVAHMYEICGAVAACEQFLLQRIASDSCFPLRRLGSQYQLMQLSADAELYIVQNLDSLPFTQADEWNSLTLEELCSLLSHSAVRGPEEVVFLAAEAWIQNNSEGAKDLLDVMHCVDLKRIPEYRLQRVTKFQQLMQHEEGARLVQEAQAYHKDRHSQSFHPHAVTRGMETLVVFACYSVEDASEGVNTDIAMDMYSMTEIREEVSSQNLNETENVKLEATRAQKMSEVQKVGGKKGVDKVVEGAGQKELKVQERSVGCTCEIGSLCLVQAGHFVFLFGTHSPREQSSEDRSAGLAAKAYKTFSRRFDASSGDWLQLAPVPMCGHVGSAVCPSEEAILLIGGGLIKDDINWVPTAAVHAYDIRTDTWSPRASHPLAVLRHAVCAHRGDAYVAGGYVPRDGDGPELQVSGALHMYSSATDTWAPRAPMLEPRAEASLVLQGDRLYLVGGGVLYGERLAVSGVESYDTAADQWTSILRSDPDKLTYGPACFVDGETILLIGGYDMTALGNSDRVVAINTKTKTVRSLEKCLAYGPSRHVCAVLHVDEGVLCAKHKHTTDVDK